MTDKLNDLLASTDVLVADGGMGTSLFALGLTSGQTPELWNVEHPDRVAAVHQGFVDVGSDIVLTNTFGGTSTRLADFALNPFFPTCQAVVPRTEDVIQGRDTRVAHYEQPLFAWR